MQGQPQVWRTPAAWVCRCKTPGFVPPRVMNRFCWPRQQRPHQQGAGHANCRQAFHHFGLRQRRGGAQGRPLPPALGPVLGAGCCAHPSIGWAAPQRKAWWPRGLHKTAFAWSATPAAAGTSKLMTSTTATSSNCGTAAEPPAGNKVFFHDPATGYIRSSLQPSKCLHKQSDGWRMYGVVHLWDCDGGPAANKTFNLQSPSGRIRFREHPSCCAMAPRVRHQPL